MEKLIKVDKNGTKYFLNTTCPCCGGTGKHPYHQVYDGVCFVCDGSGYKESRHKEYTEEYQHKLNERREKKEKSKVEKRLQYEKEHYVEAVLEPIKERVKKCNSKYSVTTCNDCQHRKYCSLAKELQEALKIAKAEHNYQYTKEDEVIISYDPEEINWNFVEVVTEDDKPCKVSKWFTNSFGGSTRKITKPDGTSFYSSAQTNRGLAKYGCKLYVKQQ